MAIALADVRKELIVLFCINARTILIIYRFFLLSYFLFDIGYWKFDIGYWKGCRCFNGCRCCSLALSPSRLFRQSLIVSCSKRHFLYFLISYFLFLIRYWILEVRYWIFEGLSLLSLLSLLLLSFPEREAVEGRSEHYCLCLRLFINR